MKKILIAVVGIVLALILLVPQKLYVKDGGTVVYHAVVYSVTKVHRIKAPASQTVEVAEFEEGTIVAIFGVEIYNDVK